MSLARLGRFTWGIPIGALAVWAHFRWFAPFTAGNPRVTAPLTAVTLNAQDDFRHQGNHTPTAVVTVNLGIYD